MIKAGDEKCYSKHTINERSIIEGYDIAVAKMELNKKEY